MNFKKRGKKTRVEPTKRNTKQKGAYFHSAIHTWYFWFHSSAFSFLYPLRMDGSFFCAILCEWVCLCAFFMTICAIFYLDSIEFSLTYSAPFLSVHTLNAMDLAHLLQSAPIQSQFTFFFIYLFFFQRKQNRILQCCCCCCFFLWLFDGIVRWSFLSKFHWFCLLILCISFDSPFTAT